MDARLERKFRLLAGFLAFGAIAGFAFEKTSYCSLSGCKCRIASTKAGLTSESEAD